MECVSSSKSLETDVAYLVAVVHKLKSEVSGRGWNAFLLEIIDL